MNDSDKKRLDPRALNKGRLSQFEPMRMLGEDARQQSPTTQQRPNYGQDMPVYGSRCCASVMPSSRRARLMKVTA